MAKIKENSSSPKLYHGTSEAIAKIACVKSLTSRGNANHFDNGIPKNIHTSNNGICLSTIYSGLMAFDVCDLRTKWGIIEVDVSRLKPEDFIPYEGFLVEKIKTKFTTEEDRLKKLEQLGSMALADRKKWRESLDNFGVCVYGEEIPSSAISKVAIFDPQTNPFIFKAVLSALIGSRFYKSDFRRQNMLTRWLMGENIEAEEWLGQANYAKMPYAEKEKISQILRNKHGLDIFYSSGSNNKKSNWW